MSGHLSGQEYQALLDEIEQGRASLHIERHWSRQFFILVTLKEVSETLGYSILPQKITVLGSLLLSILLILACMALVINDHGWLAMIIVPLIGIFWTILAGFTTEMGSLASTTGIFLFTLGVAWFLPPNFQLPLILFACSMFVYRFAHIAAQFFLVRIVRSSYRAWDMLAEHIDVHRHELSAR